MNALSPPSGTTPIGRRIFGSFLSAFIGWTALAIIFAGEAYYYSEPVTYDNDMENFVFSVIISGVLIFGTWVVALLPLYLFVPSHSALWRWPVCTICGATAAALIIYIFTLLTSSRAAWPGWADWTDLLPAAVTGGITCLFGSLTRGYFQHTPTPSSKS